MHHVVELRSVGTMLKERGYRMTPQRLMIIEALVSKDGHLTAEEIHQTVRRRYPEMSLSTVYRTLEWLTEEGMVTPTDVGSDRIAYHFMDKAGHHHLVCQGCGDVAVLDQDVLVSVRETLLKERGFLATTSHMAFFGLCASCGAKG
ncbi:MAG: transcriptional repressor [Chloroflexi bacterium]|nr:transcriptional repressor [Chloroflexota bacterium]